MSRDNQVLDFTIVHVPKVSHSTAMEKRVFYEHLLM